MRYLVALMMLGLNNCVVLPKPPQTPVCLYDNYTKGHGEKSPYFTCETVEKVKFEIPWNSPSAKNMVATPFEDYVKMNAYYKKVLDVLDKELAGRVKR